MSFEADVGVEFEVDPVQAIVEIETRSESEMQLSIRAALASRAGRGFASVWLLKIGGVAILAIVGCGPIGPIPGGALRGTVGAPDHTDWSFASEVENAQLETRPEDPHSVNTWFASVGSDLYVPTSMILGPKMPTGRSWVGHVADDDRVRIRLGDRVFERRALRVPDESSEYRTARRALEARYEIAVEDRDPERTIWIYRLDPRS